MAMNTLKDLYIDQLQDMYSADKQSLAVTKKLHEAATDSKLKDALKNGTEGIQQGMETLEGLIKGHGADPDRRTLQGHGRTGEGSQGSHAGRGPSATMMFATPRSSRSTSA